MVIVEKLGLAWDHLSAEPFIRRKFAQLDRDGNGALDQTELETLVRWTYSLAVSNGD